MRVLHVVKTSEGARWAARQVRTLVRLGAEVHVSIPRPEGRAVQAWVESGATIHLAEADLPIRRPWALPRILRDFRRLVLRVRPDIIHAHFFASAVIMRLALGSNHKIPRVFQVPGPLHLEHAPYRVLDLQTAGPRDYWIGSSRCIVNLYWQAGVPADRVFLSYYGREWPPAKPAASNALRDRLGIPRDADVVGNVNLIYPPKWYLGQRVGLKCHEDVIDAIGLVLRKRPHTFGVLIGGSVGRGPAYEARLHRRAESVGKGRIKMPGYVPPAEVSEYWPDFDCAVHVPLSENCGGVVEPLAAAVPTIASRVGGLPEVVMDGITGRTVPPRDPAALASAVLEVLENRERYRELARNGAKLVRTAFDGSRTGDEVLRIYHHLLNPDAPRPAEFDTVEFAKPLALSTRG